MWRKQVVQIVMKRSPTKKDKKAWHWTLKFFFSKCSQVTLVLTGHLWSKWILEDRIGNFLSEKFRTPYTVLECEIILVISKYIKMFYAIWEIFIQVQQVKQILSPGLITRPNLKFYFVHHCFLFSRAFVSNFK